MADQGGYRKPGSPAPVSGAGALSARTDGGPADKQVIRNLSNLPYGEGQEFQSIEQAAPMEAAPKMSTSAAPVREAAQQATPQQRTAIPFGMETMQPDVPVTDGAELGAGRGMEALGLNNPNVDQEYRAKLASYMPVLSYVAGRSDTSPETRAVIRQLRELI